MGHKQLTLAVALGALAVPAGAQAHVSLHPNTLPAGSAPTVDVRVPNETSNARTVKVDMKVPPGFTLVSPEPVAGWTALVRSAKLTKPIVTDDGTVTEQPTEVVWTAATGRGTPAGEFQSFPLQVVVPGKAGDVLSFKTVQTYSDGSTVRWIDAAGGEHPAPTVNVTAEGGFVRDQAGDAGPPAPAGSAGAATDQTTTPPAAVVKTTAATSSGASKGLGIIALVIAILAFGGALAALATRRKAAA
jgi:periplasmic copper chaperone A